MTNDASAVSARPASTWSTYVQAIMVTLPAGLALAFTTWMVLPRLRDLLRATDWRPRPFLLMWIDAADWVVSYWFIPVIGIAAVLILLENVPAWKRCRQWILFILAAVLNTIALLALTVISMTALAAFPN